MMISASSHAFVLNGETTMARTKLKKQSSSVSLPDPAPYASVDGVFGNDKDMTNRRRYSIEVMDIEADTTVLLTAVDWDDHEKHVARLWATSKTARRG
jgi:hypothetical protein